MAERAELSAEEKHGEAIVRWLSVGFFLVFMGAAQQQFQSPFWGAATDWTPVHRSGILAVVYLTFGFCRLGIGWFIRAWGEKTVLLLGCATYGLFCLAVYATTSYPLLLLAAAVWGWGGAANWGTSSVLVLDLARDGRYGRSAGRLLGSTRLGFALGVVVLSFVFDAANRSGDPLAGRVVWLWAAGFSFAGLVCLCRLPARQVETDPPSLAVQFAMMRTAKGAIGSFFLFLSGFGFGAMLGLMADHLATALPGGNRLYLAAFFSLSGALANLWGGPLSDRLGRPLSFLLTFTASAAGLLLAWALPESTGALAVCALLLGVQGGVVPMLTLAMIGEAASSARRQNAYAALFFWRDMGVAATLLVGQALHQSLSTRGGLLVLAELSLVCAALSLVLSRRAEEQFGTPTPAPWSTRPAAWALCRALVLCYALTCLLPAMLMLGLLPLAAAAVQLVGRGRARVDPWWPITSWLKIVSTMPRLAAWLDERLCRR